MRVELQRVARDLKVSNRELARRVLRKWPADNPDWPQRCDEGSLATFVGRLFKHVDGWWQARPQVAALLANELRLSVEQVIPSEPEPDADRFVFRDFPALRSLALDEMPCDLARFSHYPGANWTWQEVVANVCGRTARHWIVLPPGGGKHLLSWHLETHWGKQSPLYPLLADFDVLGSIEPTRRTHPTEAGPKRLVVQSLEESRGACSDDDRPLIVVVATREPESDVTVASELLARGNVVVFAPFPPPQVETANERWYVLAAEFVPGWRSLFLEWVQARVLGETKLNAVALENWLRGETDESVLYATPGSVLALCALAHDLGKTRFASGRPESLLDAVLDLQIRGRVGTRDDPDARWLQRHGVDAFRGLARQRFLDTAISVTEGLGLARAEWAGLVPSDLCDPPASLDEKKKDLSEFLTPGRTGGAPDPDELLRRWAGSTGRDVVRVLEDEGFLRGAQGGGLELHPAWLQRIVWTSQIKAALGDVRRWGRWCVEPGRRQVVSRVLRDLDPSSFNAFLDNLVTEADSMDPAACCAIEVGFEATARRLDGGDALRPAIDAVQAIGRRQREVWVEREPGFPTPLFGRQSGFDASWEGWVADCWAYSLGTPRPADAPQCLDWLLPGWGRPDLANLPEWLARVRVPWNDGRGDPACARLSDLASAVADRTVCGDGARSVPRILQVAVWLRLDTAAWSPTYEMTKELCDSRVAAAELGVCLAASSPDQRARALAQLWTALRGAAPATSFRTLEDAFEAFPRIKMVRNADARLYGQLVEHLTDADIHSALESLTVPKAQLLGFFSELPRSVADLPPRLRRSALAHILTMDLTPEITDAVAGKVLDAVAESAGDPHDLAYDLDTLELIVGRGGGSDATNAQRQSASERLWKADPQRAADRALHAWPEDSASAWFFAAPTHAFAVLFDRVENTPSDCWPPWTHRWLSKAFPPQPEYLERAFSALRLADRSAGGGTAAT